MFVATTATRKILGLSKRLRGVCGGTSASKTISVLLFLIDLAQRDKTPALTSVVSETVPHLKRGAIRDFMNIMETQGYFVDSRWNRTDFIYTFETGSKLEFFSADSPDKVKGPRRQRLFLNESNNVSFNAFEQLEVRTEDFVALDWNPSSEFWWYTEVKPKRTDWEEIVLTYRDNEALDVRVAASIEQRRANKNWWRVYGEGQLGTAEGRIYKDWAIIDEIPHAARLERRGLDFGYTNDPTSIVGIYRHDGGYVLDEEIYMTGMLNRQIADAINLQEQQCLVIADSAEPKSIDELKAAGVAVLPAQKGPGSVLQGIQFVQGQRISITKRSVNLIKEYRNYMWMTDKDGRIINEPEKGNDHALDAVRYGLASLVMTQQLGIQTPPKMTDAIYDII